MARTTVTQITDDIDGSANADEVAFSYGGVDYVIDLSKKNRSAFEKAIKPYVEAARRAPRKRAASRSAGNSNSRRDLNAVRQWAKEQGIEVSDRGRIAGTVLAQYDAAH